MLPVPKTPPLDFVQHEETPLGVLDYYESDSALFMSRTRNL